MYGLVRGACRAVCRTPLVRCAGRWTPGSGSSSIMATRSSSIRVAVLAATSRCSGEATPRCTCCRWSGRSTSPQWDPTDFGDELVAVSAAAERFETPARLFTKWGADVEVLADPRLRCGGRPGATRRLLVPAGVDRDLRCRVDPPAVDLHVSAASRRDAATGAVFCWHLCLLGLTGGAERLAAVLINDRSTPRRSAEEWGEAFLDLQRRVDACRVGTTYRRDRRRGFLIFVATGSFSPSLLCFVHLSAGTCLGPAPRRRGLASTSSACSGGAVLRSGRCASS